MPLCQLHTTTKNNAFILNLVVFSPEGDFIIALSSLQVWSTLMLK